MSKNYFRFIFSVMASVMAMTAGAVTTYEVNGINYAILNGDNVIVDSPVDVNMSGELTLPSTVTINGKDYTLTAIDGLAFKDCKNITSVVLPATVDSIGVQAFNGCAAMKSINLGDTKIRTLSTSAFLYCGSLQTITLPATVTSVGTNPFMESLSLKEIKVAAGNKNFVSLDGVLFTIDKKTLISFPAGHSRDYVVPEGTEIIEHSAFCMARKLRTVKFPASLKRLENNCFMRVDSLQKIELPPYLERLGASAFAECKAAAGEVVIPATCTKIQSKALYYTSISKLEILAPVTDIPTSLVQYCVKLRSITLPESLTFISAYAFNTTAISEIVIPDNVKTIKNSVFAGCTLLKNVTLGSALKTIETQVFYKLDRIQNLTINAAEPPSIADYTNYPAFTNTVYANASLIVPETSIGQYKSAETWKNFTSIKSGAATVTDDDNVAVQKSAGGIAVLGSNGAPIQVFNLTGAMLYNGTEGMIQLPAGAVYIVRVGDRTFKIAI